MQGRLSTGVLKCVCEEFENGKHEEGNPQLRELSSNSKPPPGATSTWHDHGARAENRPPTSPTVVQRCAGQTTKQHCPAPAPTAKSGLCTGDKNHGKSRGGPSPVRRRPLTAQEGGPRQAAMAGRRRGRSALVPFLSLALVAIAPLPAPFESALALSLPPSLPRLLRASSRWWSVKAQA